LNHEDAGCWLGRQQDFDGSRHVLSAVFILAVPSQFVLSKSLLYKTDNDVFV
jgi:hypothetical protein